MRRAKEKKGKKPGTRAQPQSKVGCVGWGIALFGEGVIGTVKK